MAWFKRDEPISIAEEMNKIPAGERSMETGTDEVSEKMQPAENSVKWEKWDPKEFERVADERKSKADQRMANWGAKLKLGWKLLRYAAPEMASAATHIAGEKVKQTKEDVVGAVRDKAVDMGEDLSLLYKEVGDNARNTWESVSGAASEGKRRAVDKFHNTTEAIGNGAVGAYLVYKGVRARISSEVKGYVERKAADAAREQRRQKELELEDYINRVAQLQKELGINSGEAAAA